MVGRQTKSAGLISAVRRLKHLEAENQRLREMETKLLEAGLAIEKNGRIILLHVPNEETKQALRDPGPPVAIVKDRESFRAFLDECSS